jgi:hypothetical protein
MQLIIKGGYLVPQLNSRKAIRHASNHTSIQTYTQANIVQAMKFKCEAVFLILEAIPSATTKSYEERKCIWWILVQGFWKTFFF